MLVPVGSSALLPSFFWVHPYFLKLPSRGGEFWIFWFSFIFSFKQRLRPLSCCAPLVSTFLSFRFLTFFLPLMFCTGTWSFFPPPNLDGHWGRVSCEMTHVFYMKGRLVLFGQWHLVFFFFLSKILFGVVPVSVAELEPVRAGTFWSEPEPVWRCEGKNCERCE